MLVCAQFGISVGWKGVVVSKTILARSHKSRNDCVIQTNEQWNEENLGETSGMLGACR